MFSVSSLINQDLKQLTGRFFKELEDECSVTLELQDPAGVGMAEPCVIYIASGGSEIQFAGLMERVLKVVSVTICVIMLWDFVLSFGVMIKKKSFYLKWKIFFR